MAHIRPQFDITPYDLVKTFAVLCMVIDHVGYYFFPDDNWTRVVGRMCVPIWFFLIGYANTRQIPFLLWAGAIFLVGMNAVVGPSLIPFNVLPTLIFARLALDKTMDYCLKSDVRLWGMSALLLITALPTYFISEYGTLGLILTMFGYMVRHRGIHEKITKDYVQNFMVFAAISFLIMQEISFGFNIIQLSLCTIGSFAIFLYLLSFDGKPIPALNSKIPPIWHNFLHFCGRHTLEIYIIHVTIFKIAALLLGMAGYGLFQLKILPLDL